MRGPGAHPTSSDLMMINEGWKKHYKWELEEEQCVVRGAEHMSYGFRENVKTLGAS